MKRVLLFSFGLLLCLSNLQAEEAAWQEQPNSLSISAGAISGYFVGKSLFSWIPAAAGHSRHSKYYGSYGIQYHHQLKKWCRLGVKGTWEGDNYDLYTGKNDTDVRKGITFNNMVSLVASVQFLYLTREHVQLYSGLDAGAAADIRDTRYDAGFDDGNGNSHPVNVVWLPAVNITPLGVAFGSWRFYGFVEVNIGYEAFGKAGLGVHF